MDIIVTGKPGAGKTTLCKTLAAHLQKAGLRCGGVICPMAEEGGRCVGRVAVNVRTGEKRMLPDAGGRYSPSPPGLEFGRRLISDSSGCEVVVVDDMGQMDISGTALMEALKEIVASEDNTLILVKGSLLDAFAPRLLDNGFTVFDVTEENRSRLAGEIVSYIKRSRRKK